MEDDVVPRKLTAEEINLILKIRESQSPQDEVKRLISYRDNLLQQHGKQQQLFPVAHHAGL